MRNALFRAGLAAGVFLAGQEASALAAPRPEMCVEVYDQTTDTLSTELNDKIGEFALNGMEVHIQILDDAEAEGVLFDDDVQDFRDELARLCGWDDANRLNVLVAYDHGEDLRTTDDDTLVIDVDRRGRASQLINEAERDRAIDNLGFSYVDSNGFLTISPDYEFIQKDIVGLLDDLNPYADGLGPLGAPDRGREPFKLPDIPVVPILIGVGGLALVGGTYARIRRNRSVDGRYTASLNASNAAGGKVFDAQEAAAPVVTLAPDVASELQQKIAAGDAAIVDLKQRRNAFTNLYDGLRRSWTWGSKDKIMRAAQEMDAATDSSSKLSSTISSQAEATENALAMINGTVERFQNDLTLLENAAQAAEDEGWDLGGYAERIKELRQIESEILKLRTEHQIKRPVELITEHQAKAETLRERIEQLPLRRQRMLKFKENILATQSQYSTLSETAIARLAQLRADYDPSCYESVGESEQTLQNTVNEHKALLAQVTETDLPASVDLIEEAERRAELSGKLVGIIEAESDKIEGLSERLSRLPGEITRGITGIRSDMAGLAAYTESDDVGPDTKAEIAAMDAGLKQALAGINLDPDSRPKYFEIDSSLREFSKGITAKLRKAQSQIEAAEEARQAAAKAARQAAAEAAAKEEMNRLYRDSRYTPSRPRQRTTRKLEGSPGRFGGGGTRRSSSDGGSTRRLGGGSRGSSGRPSTRRFGGGRSR